MKNNVLGTKVITLIGILVHDIVKTSQAYADFFGIEKPQWTMTDAVDKRRPNTEGSVPKQERSWRSSTWGRLR
jgi:hypothetical protein